MAADRNLLEQPVRHSGKYGKLINVSRKRRRIVRGRSRMEKDRE